MSEDTERRIYRLTRDEYEATAEKIAKLNERAEKKNLPGRLGLVTERVEVTEVVGGVEMPDGTVVGGIETTKVMWDTQIVGNAPQHGGWQFIAVLDWDVAAGLITRTAPSFEGKIDRAALRANWCDYCKTDRQRNETYLLRNPETGETRQVGSSCIKDFLGQAVTPRFFSDADEIAKDLGSYGSGATRDYDYTPESVLAVAWAVIQEFGFVRSGEFWNGEIPTKGHVRTILYPPNKGQAHEDALQLIRRLEPHIAKATGQAKLIREFVLSENFNGDSEYVANLKAICGAERVGTRHLGLLASAPQAWARSVERDLRRQAEQAHIVNEFFGEVKERVELTVHIKSIRFHHTNFTYSGETTTVYTLVTDDGHLVQWYSSNGALGDEVNNHTYKIKATIKKHEEYKDTKYTHITRAKVLDEIKPASELN